MSSPAPVLFGDVLALARQRWVSAMAHALAQQGYSDYRRSDAFALRFLASGPHALGAFGTRIGSSRQASRKVIAGLTERGYATVETDSTDARRRRVQLTPDGQAYAAAVTRAVHALNDEIVQRVSADDLATATSVLTSVIDGFSTVA